MEIDLELVGMLSSVVVALVQGLKQYSWVRDNSVVLSVLLSIGGVFLIAPEANVGLNVFSGVVVGLVACGLYSVGKKPIENQVRADMLRKLED